MSATTAAIVGRFLVLYVLSWIPVAWATGVLFPGQMLKKYPVPGQVIPLVLDCYVWADLFLLCPLITYILREVGDRWDTEDVVFLLITGFVAAVLFQWLVIVPGKYPSTLGGAGRTTLIGYLHIPFFAVVFAAMTMFLFTAVPARMVLVVAAVFAVAIPVDMLVPLHFIRKWLELSWAPNVFGEEPRLYWMIGGSWIGTAVLAITKIYWTQIFEASKYIGG